jgi:hypothetical protein
MLNNSELFDDEQPSIKFPTLGANYAMYSCMKSIVNGHRQHAMPFSTLVARTKWQL